METVAYDNLVQKVQEWMQDEELMEKSRSVCIENEQTDSLACDWGFRMQLTCQPELDQDTVYEIQQLRGNMQVERVNDGTQLVLSQNW